MPRKKLNRYGHWQTYLNLKPDVSFGFIYLITNKVNGRKYVGKKQYHLYRKTKRLRASKWEKYMSSSKELLADIKHYKKKSFKFEIIYECNTRGWLTYMEANYQHKMDVLTQWLDDDTRRYYNKQIAAIRYIPKRIDSGEVIKRK